MKEITIPIHSVMTDFLDAYYVCNTVEATLNNNLQGIDTTDEEQRQIVENLFGASATLHMLGEHLNNKWHNLDSLYHR